MKGREKLPKVHSKSYYHGIDYYFMNVSISLKYQLKTFTLKNIPNNYFYSKEKIPLPVQWDFFNGLLSVFYR